MPKDQVSDPITDQEMIFARLVLSGTMTDQQAAEAAGLNPNTVSYTKSKPTVRSYMLEHRAAVEAQLIKEDVDQHRRLTQTRERVLARLWDVADLDFESTRGNPSAQLRALALIAAIESLVPQRRAVPAPKEPAAPSEPYQMYKAAWLRKKEAEQEAEQNAAPSPAPKEAAPDPQPQPSSVAAPPPSAQPSAAPTETAVENPAPAQPPALAPRVPGADFERPDTGTSFVRSNPFSRFGRPR
jgi:hypothetical protein